MLADARISSLGYLWFVGKAPSVFELACEPRTQYQ